MHRSRTIISLAGVIALLGTLVLVGVSPANAADPADVGVIQAIFAENPAYATAPPANPAESVETPTAVSIAQLPNGQFVYWNGLENLESDPFPIAADAARISPGSRSRLLSLGEGDVASFGTPTPEDGGWFDLFCADQRVLLDGSVMASGGTIWQTWPFSLNNDPNDNSTPAGPAELFGNPATRIYSPAREAGGGTWTQAGDPVLNAHGDITGYTGYMHNGRWYPGLVTLPDGRLFVAGGVGRLIYNSELRNVLPTEIFNPYDANGVYDPKHGSWTQNASSGDLTLPLFPRLHLVPGTAADGSDGKVLYDGVGQMWGPFGQSIDELLWNMRKLYDPATNTWSDAGVGTFGALNGAISVMLPFKQAADGSWPTRILHAGGTLGVSPGLWLGTSLAEEVHINGGTVTSEQVADVPSRRWYSSGVLGATGDVFMINGADKDEVVAPGVESAVREIDAYDPATKTWKALASTTRERTYHNSAILLGDGRILIGGHSPINTLYGPGNSAAGDSNYLHNNTGLTANNLKDPSFEIFAPPYLFRGPRPTITSTVSGTFDWGSEINVSTSDSDDATVDKAMLVHLPATTHVTDADMRSVELPVAKRTSGNLAFDVPLNKAVVPPGYYRLFLIRETANGPTPSTTSLTVRIADPGQVYAAGDAMQPVSIPKASLSKGSKATGTTPVAPAAIGTSVVTAAAESKRGRPVTGSGNAGIAVAIAALIAAAGVLMRRRVRQVRT